MMNPSPLATNLRSLTRVMVLSLGILGLVGSGVAIAVWSQAGRVADRSLPVQQVSSEILLEYQAVLAGAPLLSMARVETRRQAVAAELEKHLDSLKALSPDAVRWSLPVTDEEVSSLEDRLHELNRLVQGTIQREASQAAAIASAQAEADRLAQATSNLAAALIKVRSNARSQVGASQRRSVLVNDRIKALLGTRRLLAQVELWLERSHSARTVDALADLVPRLTANADLLENLGGTLGDDFADEVGTLVKTLRTTAEGDGALALRRARLQNPEDAGVSARLAEAEARLNTAVSSLGNRTGIVIEELDNEVEEAKEAAKTALDSLQVAADAYEGATVLATGGRTLGATALAIAEADAPADVDRHKATVTALVADMTTTIARIGPQLMTLGLARERRALDESAASLAPLTQKMTGPEGLAAQVLQGLQVDARKLALLTEVTTLMEKKVTTLTAAANDAKRQTGDTMTSLTRLSAQALGLLVLVSVIALAVAWRRSRNIGTSILAAEDDQRRRAGVLAHLLTQIEAQVPPLSQSSNGLAGTSRTLHGRASGDEQQAQAVASTSRSLAEAADEVTRSAQEIRASITHISDDAQTTQQNADRAAQAAREARELIAALAKAGEDIAQATAGVSAIASQTRLLALNAAIEAASAGPAGRGFAVVANEVKSLAHQTATENEHIAQRVKAVQEAVTRATSAMARIDDAVALASDGQARIAAAVEEQTATTTEMVQRLAGITKGLAETAQAMNAIATNAGSTTREALGLTAMAEQLQGMATQLDTLVRSQSASAARLAVG